MPSPEELHIALVGLRGAGKSSVGRVLATRLGRRFVDLDDEVAQLARSRGRLGADEFVGELLARIGVGEFRALESEALAVVLQNSEPIVLASGGGVVEAESNRKLLIERAWCLWLCAAPEVLAARVQADRNSRPALISGGPLQEAKELLARRAVWYRAVARLEFQCRDLDQDQVAAGLIRALGLPQAP